MNDVTRMRVVGGDLALDYLNTRSGPPIGAPDDDILLSYADLVAWAGHIGTLSGPEMARLRRQAREDPASAQSAYRHAVELREVLDELFRAVAAGARPPNQHLARLRDETVDALAHAQIASGGDGFSWRWSADSDLARPLWPVVHAAGELLMRGRLDRIKACTGCRFLFLDESKNRSRRWCSMEDCGTAEKVRRYVARRAASRTGAGR